MGMSDCVKCWDTPCRCGHDYAHWSEKDLEAQIKMLQVVLATKQAPPQPVTEIEEVKYHPDAGVRFQFQRMIWERLSSSRIGLLVAELHDSGELITQQKEGGYVVVTLESGKVYRIPYASYKVLQVVVGQKLAIFKFGNLLYIQQPAVSVPRPEKTKSL